MNFITAALAGIAFFSFAFWAFEATNQNIYGWERYKPRLLRPAWWALICVLSVAGCVEIR